MPDENGYFGKYGGAFIPPQLEAPFKKIREAYESLSKSKEYIQELTSIRKHLQGRF
jgi:tryptophan synthase beta subunit